MTIRFKEIVLPVDCARLDEREDVLVELTSRGDLVFHNFDRETAISAVELGFSADEIPCLFLEQNWEHLFKTTCSTPYEVNKPWRIDAKFIENSFPYDLKMEAKRVRKNICKKALATIEKARYNTPSSISTFTTSTRTIISITGLNPSGREVIGAEVDRVWGSADFAIHRAMRIEMFLTIQSYMDVQNLIQDGLIIDRFSKTRAVVVAIDEVIGDSKMIVRAGRQLNNMAIKTVQVLIERENTRNKKWSVVSWLC